MSLPTTGVHHRRPCQRIRPGRDASTGPTRTSAWAMVDTPVNFRNSVLSLSGQRRLVVFVVGPEVFQAVGIDVPDTGRGLFEQIVIVRDQEQSSVEPLERDVQSV